MKTFQTHICPWNHVGSCWRDSGYQLGFVAEVMYSWPMKPGSGYTSAWPLWSVWWMLPSSLLPSCSGSLPLIHQPGKVPDLSSESKVRLALVWHDHLLPGWFYSVVKSAAWLLEITLPLQTQHARTREHTHNCLQTRQAMFQLPLLTKNLKTQGSGTKTRTRTTH